MDCSAAASSAAGAALGGPPSAGRPLLNMRVSSMMHSAAARCIVFPATLDTELTDAPQALAASTGSKLNFSAGVTTVKRWQR